jgi:hypothetical protein
LIASAFELGLVPNNNLNHFVFPYLIVYTIK